MKNRLLVITVYLSVLLFIFGCAQTKLADYQAKSSDEKEELDVIVEEDKAFENRDLARLMACYHDNATIALPSIDRNPPVVSKRQFEEYLEGGRWGEHSSGTFLNPKITIRGDEATVKCSSQATNVIVRHTYNLIKEDEKWYIIKYDYTW